MQGDCLERLRRDLIKKLRATFDYNPEGYLIRKSTGAPCGQHANHPEGYARVRVGRRILPAHRVIFAIVHGEIPGEVAHINGDRVDNRIENLRDVSRSENCHNYKIHTQARKREVYTWVDNQRIHFGMFDDFEEAVQD